MSILKEFRPNKCDSFSDLTLKDLEDFKKLLCEYKMSYRDRLNIKDKLTFGYEIECEGLSSKKVEKLIEPYYSSYDYLAKSDGSLGFNSAEVITPILRNTYEDFEIARAVLTLLNNRTHITSSCGSHIHIGAQIMNEDKETWINLLKLWRAYEAVIYRFSYGEYLNERETIAEYANPFYSDINLLIKKMSTKRRRSFKLHELIEIYAISHKTDGLNLGKVFSKFEEEGNTIEFRMPNGTLNPVIWQNNLNFFAHLLMYAKREDFDQKLINDRTKKTPPVSMEKVYSKYRYDYRTHAILAYRDINISAAIELADLLFTKNIDKINFLKQYFKDFEVCSSKVRYGNLKKAKALTK